PSPGVPNERTGPGIRFPFRSADMGHRAGGRGRRSTETVGETALRRRAPEAVHPAPGSPAPPSPAGGTAFRRRAPEAVPPPPGPPVAPPPDAGPGGAPRASGANRRREPGGPR